MKKLKPLGNRVLLEREAVEETTKSGLVIPAGSSRDTPIRCAKIVAKGPECTDAIKVGQTVVISEFVGQELDEEGTDFIVVRETELIGIAS